MFRLGMRSEEEEGEDASTFDLGNTASKSEMEAEVRSAGNRTTLFLVAIVGVLSVALVMCVAVSLVVYYFAASRRPLAQEAEANKPLPPPKEIKARINEVNVEQKTIKLLVRDGKYQTFQITAETELFDAAGQRLAKGINSPELCPLEDVVILPTPDQESLQWLKLKSAK